MEFRILGPLEVIDSGKPVSLGAGKQRSLLALLLLHPNEVLHGDALVDALWGERPPPTAAKMLHNHVSHLRRALSAGDPGGQRLETRGNGYVLRVSPGERDVDRFEERLEDARARGTGDPKGKARVLREALGLWRGPPLSDFTYEDFAREEIGRLEELRLGALEELFDAELALGRHGEIVAQLTRLAREHPLRERLLGQLMLALYRSGRQAEALEAYQTARRALIEERGLDPGTALQQLQQAILRQDPDLGTPTRSHQAPHHRRQRRRLVLASGAFALTVAAVVTAIAATGGSDPLADRGPIRSVACSSVASGPDATPRLLIAASLPVSGPTRSLGAEMDAAIRFVLSERDFRAGRHSVGYQVCDEAEGESGLRWRQVCRRNARAFARHERLVAVIGAFTSGCSGIALPIANRAGLAMVSPSNTYAGLTRAGPGSAEGDPERLYPTGRRTYARLVPDDGVQAAAGGMLAHRLGIRRLFLLHGISAGDQAGFMMEGVAYAARHLGVRVVGRDVWSSFRSDFKDLARRVRRSRPDGVFLSGAVVGNEGRLVARLRAALPSARFLAPDGFSSVAPLVDGAGPAAEGLIVTVPGASPDALTTHGRRFAVKLAEHLGLRPGAYTLHAAQAAEVVLDALARSDGSRAAVVREIFRTRVRDGITGDFSFTSSGDTTEQVISAHRISGGRIRHLTDLRPPPELLLGDGDGD